MPSTNHSRLAALAIGALIVGLALRDCVLLSGGVLLWTAHLHAVLDSSADRSRAWLNCIGSGAAMVALGLALGLNTLAVVFGVWPGPANERPWLAALALLVLIAVIPGARPLAWVRLLLGLALLAEVTTPLTGAHWLPCAFAACAAMFAVGDGVYRLGPLARHLAASQRLR